MGLGALVYLVGMAPALAEEARPVPVAYDVPAGCPDERDFLDMVARDGGLLQAREGTPRRSFEVRVTGTGPVVGRVVVREGDGTEAVRTLDGPRCEDVVRALAVILALSIDAPLAAPERTESPIAPSPPADPEPESAEPLPPVPGIAAATPDALEPAPDDEQAAGGRPDQGWRVDFTGAWAMGASPAQKFNSGVAAYVELLDETSKAIAPAVRAGFLYEGSQKWTESSSIGRVAGRLDACPFRGVASQPWSEDAFTLQPCVRIEIGRLRAERTNVVSTDVTRLWLAPAALLRFRWTSPHLFVEAEGGASFPLVRERFSFGPGDPDLEIQPVALVGGLGLGVFIEAPAVR